MSCKCAKQTDEYHGWECSITEGECMYLIPDQDACADEYGDVEHTGMTDKEAKQIIDNGQNIQQGFEDGLKSVDEAMEKQTPKKPNLEGDGYADGNLVYDTWICPNCNTAYEIDYDCYDYCPACGQKIDWSE